MSAADTHNRRPLRQHPAKTTRRLRLDPEFACNDA